MNNLTLIGLKDLEVVCILGVLPRERTVLQKILVDVDLTYDAAQCVKEDTMTHAIDYRDVADLCTKLAQEKKFQLLETYAHSLVEALFASFPIANARVYIRKSKSHPSLKTFYVQLEKKRCMPS